MADRQRIGLSLHSCLTVGFIATVASSTAIFISTRRVQRMNPSLPKQIRPIASLLVGSVCGVTVFSRWQNSEFTEFVRDDKSDLAREVRAILHKNNPQHRAIAGFAHEFNGGMRPKAELVTARVNQAPDPRENLPIWDPRNTTGFRLPPPAPPRVP
jgi:hypothetical protein